MKNRLLISVRGAKEALLAAQGGAQIADVEYPASALGTPYPLNIKSVSDKFIEANVKTVEISTNIGEIQNNRSSACQAALGVATAGADIIKFGLAELPIEAAIYQGETIVRTVKHWFPNKKLIPAVFIDLDLKRFFNPFTEGLKLVQGIKAEGLLIDTFNKSTGYGLLDLCSIGELALLVKVLHDSGFEAWFAGSITLDELPGLWEIGTDVVCVRGAACATGKGNGRFGEINLELVKALAKTIPVN